MTDIVTAVCKALAHPARRALLRGLATAECDVGHLGDTLGLDQPEVSKQLASLRRAGLVQVRVEGRRRCYSLTHRDMVVDLLSTLGELQTRVEGPAAP